MGHSTYDLVSKDLRGMLGRSSSQAAAQTEGDTGDSLYARSGANMRTVPKARPLALELNTLH